MASRKLGVLVASAAALVLAVPAGGRAQGPYEVPPSDPQAPLPLFHARPENGGFFTAIEFVMMQQTRPTSNQIIGRRGAIDTDGTLNSTPIPGTSFLQLGEVG